MQKNQEIVLKITDFTAEGSGVGRYASMAVFVPDTAIDDEVKVKILKVKKNYAYGKVTEIITPSKQRIHVDCASFGRCGGCVFRHINYKSECDFKQNKVKQTISRIGGVDLEPEEIICANNINFYRNKAQLPIDSFGKAGFFAFHSHRIVGCEACKLQPVIFADIIKTCEEWISQNNISVYNEETNKGLLRHIYLRMAKATNQIMLTLIINGESLPHKESLIKALSEKYSEIKSIQININKSGTNVILGEKCVCLYGEPYITDVLCDIKVRLSPLSFYQVNREMAQRLYEKAAEYLEAQNKNIIDLYCGAGTIGLSVAKKAKSIIGVEIVEKAIEDAKFNAMQNGVENARFICSDAAAAAQLLANEGIRPDAVILDPPRKGCAPELIKTVAEQFAPERVVYVSCDVATLARDIKLFCERGYSLVKYTPVDLFPRTAHVETVALLKRKEVKQ